MSLLEQIFAAGVVGCGGAGFPTHAKLSAKVEYFILNGAECEPLLRTDRWLMIHHAREIVAAAVRCKEQVEAANCVLLLKESYHAEAAALETAIAALCAPVQLHKSESFYPAGDEQVIVYEVTGRVVPPLGIPLDVGCVVSNVATMLAVHDAQQGIPVTHKYLTVSGEVRSPAVLRVPLGTPVADCIAQAGGTPVPDYGVLLGGPMMGRAVTGAELAEAVVTKTTSGVLVLPAEHPLLAGAAISMEQMSRRAGSACIQCSYCTQLCPRHLLGHPLEPHRIMRRLASGGKLEELLDDPAVQHAQLCCECGICELFACPMQLQPRRVNGQIKRLLAERGFRLPKGETGLAADPERPGRKIPTRRAAVRAGVGDYYRLEPQGLREYTPTRVELPLHQQLGAPAEPVVRTGDRVRCGQLVAACPQGKLGANLHASIDGVVRLGSASIIIEEGRG